MQSEIKDKAEKLNLSSIARFLPPKFIYYMVFVNFSWLFASTDINKISLTL